jgi:hypothetical protein
LGTPLIAQESTKEASQDFFNGTLYSRASTTYQYATDYYSGYSSFASTVFDNLDGEYSFVSYNLDVVYILPSGFYLGTGLYTSAAKVEATGLPVPNTDSDIELRELPLSIGYDMRLEDVQFRFEARYTFNIDDDFNSANNLTDTTILPVTDGSDSLTLSFRAKKLFVGLEHSLTLGYQIYENGVEHPLFDSFSLGDRVIVDYEISKIFGKLKLSGGHLFSASQQTKGDTSGITGTAYLTEKPQYAQLRTSATYQVTPQFYLDGGIKYTYTGKDAPKEKTFYIGAAYLF